jgi:formylglycine-generating enzyme required for sulfatase activity
LVDTINVYSSAIARNEVFFVEDERFGQVVKMVGQGFVGSSGGHIELPEPTFTNKSAYAVSFWIKEHGFTSWHGDAYITAGTGANSRSLLGHYGEDRPPFYLATHKGIASMNLNPDRFTFSVDSSTITDIWNHYAISENNGTATVFRNGTKIYDAPVSGEPQGNWHLGRLWWYGGSEQSTRLVGSVANLRIYDRTLSAGEVSQLLANDIYEGYGLEGAATKSPFDPATAANWSAGGDAWTVDTAVSHDGVDSVKAQTTDGQSTYREYTVVGPAVVDFWWKVSSEELYDTFSYSVNGVNQQTSSGEVDWTYRTLTLPAGTHTIRWTYTKDESGAVGQDAGWLDDFAVYPATASLQVRDGATVLDGEATVDFGSADTGSTGFTKSLTFANEGYVPLEVELSLPEGSPFAFDDGTATYELLVGRGESVDVPIVLSTAGAGTKTAQLTISAPDSTVAPPLSVTLTGYVRGPDIGLAQGTTALTSGQTFDMGLAPRTVEFTIRNNGNSGDLAISGISATGNFQITQQPAATIPPQTSTTFKVLAQSVASGVQAGSISISSNAGNLAEFSLPLSSKSLIAVPDGVTDGSMATSGTGGAAGWDFGTTVLPSGQSGSALKTGATPNSGGSVLAFTAQTAGVVSWTWKVSTQENFDWLLCEVDGQEAAGISTKNGVWQTQVVNVPAGANVRWVYRKDASGTIGEDAGYLADVEFRSLAANQSFSQWAQTQNVTDPQQRMPKSGLQAMFGWLGGFGVDGENTDGNHKQWILSGSLTYRYPVSKMANGTQQLLYSSDMSSWTTRRISQRIVSEDADRVVIEATAPSGTKGFFKVVGNRYTGTTLTVQGGTLPASSPQSGTVVPTFLMAKYEVTWDEWREVRAWSINNGYDDLSGAGVGSAGDSPVVFGTWYEAVKWCNAKSEMEGLVPAYWVGGEVYRTGEFGEDGSGDITVDSTSNGYRLPTQAEWDWAARGGVFGRGYTYSGSNDVNAVAWYSANSSFRPSAVGTKSPNELGIYDMSGNVWEWVFDGVGSYPGMRGGSWADNASDCSVNTRLYFYPNEIRSNVGFRVARHVWNR